MDYFSTEIIRFFQISYYFEFIVCTFQQVVKSAKFNIMYLGKIFNKKKRHLTPIPPVLYSELTQVTED